MVGMGVGEGKGVRVGGLLVWARAGMFICHAEAMSATTITQANKTLLFI
jgi:hypothetical protein